jgi:outer membrane lipoprotein SlyB
MGTRQSLPAGRQPYDALTGLRIGAVAGALVGALLALLIGTGMVWLIVALGAVGGVLGYRFEQHEIEHDRERRPDGPTD